MAMTNTIWNDAGLLREFCVRRNYGSILEFGNVSFSRWQRVRRHVERIAKLTGLSYAEVQKDLIDEYSAMEV